MPNKAEDRADALKGARKQIDEQFGKGCLIRLGDEGGVAPMAAIPTGVLTLDRALGIGGVPRGRIVEIFGSESAGKTTLVYHILAQAQRAGACAFIDAEHSLDPTYAAAVGVDVDDLLVCQPDHGEQALEIMDVLLREEAVEAIAVDSVAALIPRAELEGQMGDQHVGLQPRMMSQALRKLAGNLRRANAVCIFTNQIREKVGVIYGSPETQPGGRALKFYASQRIDVRRIGQIKDGEEIIGHRARAKIVKNKTAAPYREAEFDIEYGHGASAEGCLIDLGLEYGLVKKSGAHLSFGDERLGQGRIRAKVRLAEDGDLRARLEEQIQAKLRAV